MNPIWPWCWMKRLSVTIHGPLNSKVYVFPTGAVHHTEEVFLREQDWDPGRRRLDRTSWRQEIQYGSTSLLCAYGRAIWPGETSENQRQRLHGGHIKFRESTAHSCSRALCLPLSIFCLNCWKFVFKTLTPVWLLIQYSVLIELL